MDESSKTLNRRQALGILLGVPAALAAGAGVKSAFRKESNVWSGAGKGRMPVGFVGHGAPTLALDEVKGADLKRWGEALPRPSSILMVSAHWQDAPLTLSATAPTELVYDFYGFPRALYQIRHDAPPAPDLAGRVEEILGGGLARSPRGLDHGAWVPLRHLDPEAAVPVLQLSMPATFRPDELLSLGKKLAPLRDEGVWIVGSGNVVHNLRQVDFSDGSPPPMWAVEFDHWVEECLARGDVDSLCDHRTHGPGSRMAHPTDEHFRPLLVAIGAAGDIASTEYPVKGFEYGSISRRCVSFG